MPFAALQSRVNAGVSVHCGDPGNYTALGRGQTATECNMVLEENAAVLNEDSGAYERLPLALIPFEELDDAPMQGDRIEQFGRKWIVDRVQPEAGAWELILRLEL